MEYTLTLPKGAITKTRNGIYQGSTTEAQWAPFNPNDRLAPNKGWQPGDTLSVVCTFNLNPPGVTPPPPAKEYVGLCAGACATDNPSEIAKLIKEATRITTPAPGRLVGNGIELKPQTPTAPAATSIFYNAVATTQTVVLSGSRGTLTDYVYKWTMEYNAANTVATGTTVEIVFGYGDPMNSEVQS